MARWGWGTVGKMVGCSTEVGYQTGDGMGFQTGCGSSHVVKYQTQVGYQTVMVGYQTGGGTPDACGGVPDAGDDGVPGRGSVTTLMSHQSEILDSLIFFCSYEIKFFLAIPYLFCS